MRASAPGRSRALPAQADGPADGAVQVVAPTGLRLAAGKLEFLLTADRYPRDAFDRSGNRSSEPLVVGPTVTGGRTKDRANGRNPWSHSTREKP